MGYEERYTGASRTPHHLRHRAMERAHRERRLPDRGNVRALELSNVLPDGTEAGTLPGLTPLLQALLPEAERIYRSRLTAMNRAQVFTELRRNAYRRRELERQVTIIPPGPGPVFFAKLFRRKPGAPGGAVGAVRDIVAQPVIGNVYQRAIAPATAVAQNIAERMQGNVAPAPVGATADTVRSSDSHEQLLEKVYAFSPNAADAGEVEKPGAWERYGLFAAVTIFGFMILRGKT